MKDCALALKVQKHDIGHVSAINKELAEYFITSLRERGDKSEGTINNIIRDLDKLLSFCEAEYDSKIDADSIKAFIEELRINYKESSYVSKLSSIRQFVNWLNLADNPFWDLRVALSNDDFSYYSRDDIFVHSMGCVREPYSRQLNKLVLGFVYEFYLTLPELSELRLSDYNLAAGSLSLRGKEIETSASLRADIKEYLKTARLKYLIGDLAIDDHLLVNERSLKFSVQDLRARLAEMELRPVYIRRSRVIHLLESGLSTEDIETKLAIKLGQVYEDYEQEPDYRLLKAYNQFHPRADA